MIKIERIKCGSGNCFLIKEGDNSVLVDTSRIRFRKKILEICKNSNVKLIVLTHGHVDHIQNALYLSKELNVPIAMHKADFELSKNNTLEPLQAHGILGKLVLALLMKSLRSDKIDPFEPTIFLHEGDILDDYGVHATVIELPGHTKGSIGLKFDNNIFVGDALMNLFYPTKSMLYENKKEMEKSASKIANFGTTTIHFGHGKSTLNRNW